jgi:VanZ family protein
MVLWQSTGWLLIAAVIYLSLASDLPDIPGEGSDKYGHLIAYGALMFWFTQIYTRLRTRVAIASGLILLGIALEFIQGYTGYRMFDLGDMIANAIGVIVGWIAAPPRTANVFSFLEKRVLP